MSYAPHNAPRQEFDQKQLENEAMRWLLDEYFGKMGEAERRQFELWLNTSYAHQKAFEHAKSMWQQIEHGDTLRMPAIEVEEETEEEHPSQASSYLPLVLASLISILLIVISIYLS